MPATQARKELVAQQVRWATATDVTVKNRSKRATRLERVSTLDAEVDAQAVSDEILALRKARRHAIRLTVFGQQFKRTIGESVTLAISDFKPGAQDAILLSVSEDTANQTTELLVWA